MSHHNQYDNVLFSGVAGVGVCVVSVEGRGSGGCAPGKKFRFPPQSNGVLVRFRAKKDYKTKNPLQDERLKTFLRKSCVW